MEILPNGTRVRTAKVIRPRDFIEVAQKARVPNQEGVIQDYVRGHGLCYLVVFDAPVDGQPSGYFDPDELEVLGAIEDEPALLAEMVQIQAELAELNRRLYAHFHPQVKACLDAKNTQAAWQIFGRMPECATRFQLFKLIQQSEHDINLG